MGTQVGILVKTAGWWNYYGMVPLMDDPRTRQIIQRQAGLKT